MKRNRDPRIPSDLFGRPYPLGQQKSDKAARLKKYAMEALLLPTGVVILQLYLAFYKTWDAESYTVNVPKLIVSFALVYILYFLINWLYSEHCVKKYEAWKNQTFHNKGK